MNIHEFQAKQLFDQYGIPVSRGYAVRSAKELDQALAQMEEGRVVVKAQTHAGGRGKGTFVDGFKGGVRIAGNREEARAFAQAMLGNTLVTHQTGAAGRVVGTVLLTEPCAIAQEFYLAILLDRATSCPVVIASTEGGVEIEAVAEKTPDRIARVQVDPALGLQPFQARRVAFALGFREGDLFREACSLVANLYRLFWERDASLVEINPLVVTKEGHLNALDAKVSFEDNALFRQPAVMEMRDLAEEDPKEVEASRSGLSYIALDGDIACLVNGAGLAMSTMDIIKHYGGNPANFLDVGGGATEQQVTEAFRIILSDPKVKGILVNIFGGIMRCQTIASGIVAAARNAEIRVPLVVRLEGNQVAEGKATLAASGLPLVPADSLADAARQIVSLVASLDGGSNPQTR